MYEFSSKSRQSASNYEQILTNGKRSYNYQNMQRSNTRISQTDKRIQEIKRKYDTPNRKERMSQLSVKKSDFSNKQNDNYGTADFKTKQSIYSVNATEENQYALKESKALMRNSGQRNYDNSLNANIKNTTTDKYGKQAEHYEYKMTSNKLYKNENEEQFFKRVKQMKQSLMCGDNNRPNQNRSSTLIQSKQSRTKSGYYDSNQTIEKVRIDNIDKINQKIKGILECLNENQKTRMPPKYGQQKKSKLQGNHIYDQYQQLTKTPTKNMLTSSIMGRSSFGNHRHERSEILDKIEINRDCKDRQEITHQGNFEEQKWQKLSNKLQKYEFENKNRLQKALQTSKQVEKQQSPRASNVVENNIVENRNNRSFIQNKKQSARPAQVIRRDNKSVDFKDLRSRSFLYQNLQSNNKAFLDRDRSLNSKMAPIASKQYAMKSGKKLDDQIDRLQKKIQQFQQQKKRLNIQFKPFNYSNTKSTSNLGFNIRHDNSQNRVSEFTKCLYKDTSRQQQNSKRNAGSNENQSTFRQNKQLTSDKQSFRQKNEEKRKLPDYHRLNSKIEIKLERSNPSSVRTSKFINQDCSSPCGSKDQQESYAFEHQTKQQIKNKPKDKEFVYFFDQSLKKQTDEGIQDRRKRLLKVSQNTSQKNAELKAIVRLLCEQVKLDQDFRNAKIWYEYNGNPRKQQEIKRLLPDKTSEQIKQIFKVRQSQNNPFFTAQGYQSSIQKLVEHYSKSEDHWISNLHKQFDRNQLARQGFSLKQIDLEKKGHVNLGDLVRFLNLQSGTFYRNRDLALVFIRVCRQNQITSYTELDFKWLIDAFCE